MSVKMTPERIELMRRLMVEHLQKYLERDYPNAPRFRGVPCFTDREIADTLDALTKEAEEHPTAASGISYLDSVK